MGIINVYNTVSNEKKVYKANGKLKNIFPKMDFKHSIVIKAGEKVNGEYEVTPEDVLYCRVVPGSTAVLAVVAIVSAVVAIGVGVGSAIYANKKSAEAQEQMEKAQRDAENMANAVTNLPFCRGANNVAAMGRSIQFVMGDVYNTPYKLSDGFYSIDGQNGVNSYYNVVLSAGYKAQTIRQILIGEEVVVTNNSGIHGVQNFDNNSLYYESGANNLVEVREGNENFTNSKFGYKVSSTYAMSELVHEYGEDAVPVIVQLAQNAKKVQVCIQFASLREYDSELTEEQGGWVSRTATVRPYWSNDGGANWHEFNFSGMNNNSITLNVNHTVRFVAEKEFAAAESYGKQISIKVVKETAKLETSSQETCHLLYYQTFCYDPMTSNSQELNYCKAVKDNNVLQVGFRIKANDNTKDILNEIHCLSYGKAHIYNGSNWNDIFTTRNPASWLKELLTSDFHSPSKYSDIELNLDSFEDLYNYCEDNEFYCDGIITADDSKQTIIEKILSSVNADLIINHQGELEIAIDKEETNPVALINDENIVSFTYSKDLNRRVDGEKVTYINRQNWMPDTFYSMLDGGTFDEENDVVEPISFDYVTTYEHAYKMAQRKMRQRQLMPFELKAEVGAEGYSYPLYSLIKAQITMLQQGIRSSLISELVTENNKITKIRISDLVTFEENKRYGVTIQATTQAGHRIYNSEVTGTGATRELTLVEPIDIDYYSPIVSNHLSFGLLDNDEGFSKVTLMFKIYGIEPKDDGYILTLRTYNPEVYSYGGSIPAYKSNLTKKQKPNTSVTIEQIDRLRQDMSQMQSDLIDAYQNITMPVVVDADNKQFIFELNTEGELVTQTTFETQIFCKQGSENRPFAIGELVLPNGWHYTVENKKIIFTIGEGTKITSGTLVIPVLYRPAISYREYTDQDGNPYISQDNEIYNEEIMSPISTTYNVYISYLGVSTGAYLDLITSVADIPNSPNINDFFVWGGENNTSSELVAGGKLKQATVYKYIGTGRAWKYDIDEDVNHVMIAMSDILGIANADLHANNSTAWQYLDHLTSNSIYSDMIVANQAFIDSVAAKVITADIATVDDLTSGVITVKNCELVQGQTVITGGKINTNLIEANSIKADKIDIENLKAQDALFNDVNIEGNLTLSINGEGTTEYETFGLTDALGFKNLIKKYSIIPVNFPIIIGQNQSGTKNLFLILRLTFKKHSIPTTKDFIFTKAVISYYAGESQSITFCGYNVTDKYVARLSFTMLTISSLFDCQFSEYLGGTNYTRIEQDEFVSATGIISV